MLKLEMEIKKTPQVMQFQGSTQRSFLLLSILLGLVTGCGHPDSESGGTTPPETIVQDLNDHKACAGETPDDVSIFGPWQSCQLFGEGKKVTQIFSFTADELKLQTQCEKKDLRLQVQVQTPIRVLSKGEFEILKSREVTDEVQSPDSSQHLACAAQISSGRVRYHLQGRCLKIEIRPEHWLTLVPAAP